MWALWQAFVEIDEDLVRLILFSDGSGSVLGEDDDGKEITLAAWATLATAPAAIRERTKLPEDNA